MTEEKKTGSEEVVLNMENEALDSIHMSSEVVAMIAGIAASEVKGVAGMGGGVVGGIAEKLGRKDFSRGIKVTLKDSKATLDLQVIVNYGVKIMEVAEELKKAVRDHVENITGLEIEAVSIDVIGISLPAKEIDDTEEVAQEDEVKYR